MKTEQEIFLVKAPTSHLCSTKNKVELTSEELELLKNLLQDDLICFDYLKYRPKFKTYKIPENWPLLVEALLKKLEILSDKK